MQNKRAFRGVRPCKSFLGGARRFFALRVNANILREDAAAAARGERERFG